MSVSENMIPLILMQLAVIFSEVSGHHLPVWCIHICVYIYMYIHLYPIVAPLIAHESRVVDGDCSCLMLMSNVCMSVCLYLYVCLSVCLSVCVQTHPHIILLATYLTNMQMTSHSYPICMYIGCTRNSMVFLYDIPILCHTIGIPIYIPMVFLGIFHSIHIYRSLYID